MLTLLLHALLFSRLGPIADAPARGPQMAANGSVVAMTFGAGKAIYFTTSRDGGESFGPPVKVGTGEIIPLNRHRGPRVAFAGTAIVISAVTGKKLAEGPHAHGLPSDGDLMVWRSTDNGKTWSPGRAVNDVPGAATEGLHALAADGKGGLFAVWLDKRTGEGTQLYGARSVDGGVTWSKNTLVYASPDQTICQCCHPSIALDGSGQILVMWRNALAGSRDMYLTRSANGSAFSKPEKLGNGTWPLNACPMDGGGIASANGRTVTAWRRADKIFLAEPGKAEQEIGAGKDVALALSQGQPVAVWTNGKAIESWAAGKTATIGESGAFPSLVALPGGGALAAWEDNGAIVTRRLPSSPK